MPVKSLGGRCPSYLPVWPGSLPVVLTQRTAVVSDFLAGSKDGAREPLVADSLPVPTCRCHTVCLCPFHQAGARGSATPPSASFLGSARCASEEDGSFKRLLLCKYYALTVEKLRNHARPNNKTIDMCYQSTSCPSPPPHTQSLFTLILPYTTYPYTYTHTHLLLIHT